MTPTSWSIGDDQLDLEPGVLVGILNVTPDSFSDGGEFFDHDAALAHALTMTAEGASIVDVGGESTRPGAAPVSADEELERVLPVVAGLVSERLMISIDTSKPEVAAASLDTGAVIVNDVTGFTDPRMIDVVSGSSCGLVIMHGREHPLDELPSDADPVDEVAGFLVSKADELVAAGVDRSRIVIDPGIGFAKRPEQSLALLAGIDRLVAHGMPVLVGTSRKSFLSQVLGDSGWESRDNATAATTALGYLQGARLFRVHDVAKSRDALRVAAAIVAPH